MRMRGIFAAAFGLAAAIAPCSKTPATPPTPTPPPRSGSCQINGIRIKTTLEFGKSVVGKQVTFEVGGASRRLPGRVRVDFGDGSTEDSTGPWDFDRVLLVSHIYRAKGTFKVTAGPGPAASCSGDASVSLVVGDAAVLGSVTGVVPDSVRVHTGDAVGFTVSGKNGNVPCRVILGFGEPSIWSYGDKKGSLPLRFEKTYEKAGTYKVHAQGMEGCTGETSASVEVRVTVPLAAITPAPGAGSSVGRTIAAPQKGTPLLK